MTVYVLTFIVGLDLTCFDYGVVHLYSLGLGWN